MIQVVDDGDGLAAVPAGELGGAQEGIILGVPLGIFFLFSDKEQDDTQIFTDFRPVRSFCYGL